MATTWVDRPISRRSALFVTANALAAAAFALAGGGPVGRAFAAEIPRSAPATGMPNAYGGQAGAVKSTSRSSVAGSGYRVFHVRTADFEFDLPSYWCGKVEWFEETLSGGYSQVTICPLGMVRSSSSDCSKYALVTVRSTDANARHEGGDIGGGLVAAVDGASKDVLVYQRNWAFICHEQGPDSSTKATKYTSAELDRLIDLSTGGKYDYSDCKSGSHDMACMEYNQKQFKGRVKAGSFSNPAQPAKTACDYVMESSDIAEFNKRVWYNMDTYELFLARNELFARHGCGFKTRELRDYFGRQAWYKETIDAGTYDTDILNGAEKQNATFILEIEKERNSPYI